MYTTYVLYSPAFHKIYVGFSSELTNRLLSHNDSRNTGWTSRYQPWEFDVRKGNTRVVDFHRRMNAKIVAEDELSYRFRQELADYELVRKKYKKYVRCEA